MFARLSHARKLVARYFALTSMVWLAACDPIGLTSGSADVGQTIDTSAPVQVALLVPGGSDQEDFLARNFENAARLAIADLNGPKIRLRVYNTGGNPTQAANMARSAVNDGAQIILGPLFAEAANAVGIAVADQNVNVLAFSNNPTIAGGNVFILGPTFQNTANRLVRYAGRQGINRYTIAHANDIQGTVGRDSIATAIRADGGQITGTLSYPLSEAGVQNATTQIAQNIKSTGANALFTTANISAELPILASALPQQGVDPAQVSFIGLTRWDALPQALSLPGLQGGLFAMPDTKLNAQFESRYAQTYGGRPHQLAGLAYDGIAAIGSLVESGNKNALTKRALTTSQGFKGTSGIFRLLPNGLNERGLAVATIRNNQVTIVEQAPTRFSRGGF